MEKFCNESKIMDRETLFEKNLKMTIKSQLSSYNIDDNKIKRNSTNKFLHDFNMLFNFSLIVGVPLRSNELKTIATKNCSFITYLCIFIGLLRFFAFVFLSCSIHFFLRFNSMIITYYALHLFAFASLICTISQRRSITNCVRKMALVMSQINCPSAKGYQLNVPRATFLHVLGILLIVGTLTPAMIMKRSVRFASNPLKIFGFSLEGKEREDFLISTRVALVLVFASSEAICSAVSMLSSTAYFYIGEIIHGFGKKLKMRLEYKSFSQESISENILMFQRIVSVTHAVDEAFSNNVLFVFGSVISCFFNALSVALSIRGYPTVYVYAAVMFTTGLGNFLRITIGGQHVITEYQKLKHLLVECSEIVTQNYLNQKELTSFSLMVNDIKTADLYVSSGNMFEIRKGLIITVIGVLVSYGVLILQLDQIT